ncbi:uncharacterized protein ISCGN_010879 [Ixodes scapularis]
MLQRDESDLALSVINPTSQKTDVAVATETILPIELMILAGRLSRHQSHISGFVKIFPWEAWTCFLCGIVLSAILWTTSDYVHAHLNFGDERTRFRVMSVFHDHLWSFIENICLEASSYTPRRVSARIVVATFWLSVIILTTVFAGQMKTMMMIKEESGRIDNMKDLSLKPEMKPYTVAGSAGVSSVRYAPYHVISEEGLNVPVRGVCGEILSAITQSMETKRVSARIVVATFWLAVIILTTVFAGQMKAMMMIKEESGRIDNMKDLSLKPEMKPYTVAGSAGVSSVRDSKDPSYQKVWRMMQRHKSDQPPAIVLSDGTMRELVQGKAVLIMSRAALAARATTACANSDAGEYYVGKEAMFNFNSVFYLNKRMPLARQRAINSRILWLRDSGLVAKWWKDSSGSWEGCGQTISDGTLTFADFTDVVKMWLVMLAAAGCVFLAEFICGRTTNRSTSCRHSLLALHRVKV